MNRVLAISIINYRTADLTIGCVQSVLDDLGNLDAEIIVVDNLSEDGSADQIAAWIDTLPSGSPVRLLRSTSNSGFSGGHNQGMASAHADYYLILNSDAVVRQGFLARILDAARRHPDAGFIAPRLEHEDGVTQISCFRFPNPLSELIRGANSGPVTRMLQAYDVPLGPDLDEDAIGWASFACILVNGAMMRDIGPMDEGYFLYFEDAEYCLRARRAGWRIRRCPQAVAVHFRGGSGPVKSIAKARGRLPAYYYSSRTRFFYQAYGRVGLWLANMLWSAGRGLALLRRVFGRPSDNARAFEGRDIWTNILKPLGPRRAPGE
ncbi:glycosyltransferase family 2 protein [Gymnodinialimonas sp. 2305UL16-5]|uniref:glycosyltransferase family 2 protein n=1 Tax=Gymnodinialimonas mytili TaxID=3126503 RepID=UPI0030B18785